MPWHIHKEGLGFCESATPPLQLPVQTRHKHFTSRGRKLAPGQGGREPVSHQGNVFGFVAGKRSCLELGRIKLYKPQAWEISNQLTSCFLTFVSFLVATKQRAILPKHFPPHRKQWNQLCQLPVHLLTEQISKSLSSCGSLWGGGYLATSEICWRPLKTMLSRGQVKGLFLPLGSSLWITSFCVQPEKSVISGISGSNRTREMQPGADVGSTATPLLPTQEWRHTPTHGACRDVGQPTTHRLTCLVGGSLLRPGKCLPSPRRWTVLSHLPPRAHSPVQACSVPHSWGDSSHPPSCPARTPSTKTTCKGSCDSSHQGASPGWACRKPIYNWSGLRLAPLSGSFNRDLRPCCRACPSPLT